MPVINHEKSKMLKLNAFNAHKSGQEYTKLTRDKKLVSVDPEISDPLPKLTPPAPKTPSV